jgi:AcrR family transcriptional regulator
MTVTATRKSSRQRKSPAPTRLASRRQAPRIPAAPDNRRPPNSAKSATPGSGGGGTSRSTKRTSSDEQLLRSTSQLLASRAAIQVSLSEIAEVSGLNSSLVKYHFGSKDGLLLALVRRDATVLLRQLDHLMKLEICAEQKIRLHVAGIVGAYVKYPYLNQLMHYLLTNSEERIAQEIALFFVKPLVEAQTKILDEGFAQGLFRRTDPMLFYYSVNGACDYIFFGRASRKVVFGVDEISTKIRDGYIDYVCDMVLRFLRKQA